MAVKMSDLTITSLDTLKAFRMNGDFWFVLDELQDATISQTQDQEEVTGRGGRRINTLKRNKACTVSGNNGLLSAGLLEIQTGSDWAMGSDGNEATIEWDEVLDVNGGVATTEFKAVGTPGTEIHALHIRDANGIAIGTFSQVASNPSDGEFTYDPVTKKLQFATPPAPVLIATSENVPFNLTTDPNTGAVTVTCTFYSTNNGANSPFDDEHKYYIDFDGARRECELIEYENRILINDNATHYNIGSAEGNAITVHADHQVNDVVNLYSVEKTPVGVENGTEIWVEYTRKIHADVLTNDSTNYSGKARVYIDATAEDKCGSVYHVQFYFPKGDFNGEFDIEMSDSQNPHAWEFESLAGACGAGGTLWTLTVFGENTQDV